MISECVKLEGILGIETDKAILFSPSPELIEEFQLDGKDMWLPLSQVKEIHRTRSLVNGTLDSIVISKWLAEKKGIV